MFSSRLGQPNYFDKRDSKCSASFTQLYVVNSFAQARVQTTCSKFHKIEEEKMSKLLNFITMFGNPKKIAYTISTNMPRKL